MTFNVPLAATGWVAAGTALGVAEATRDGIKSLCSNISPSTLGWKKIALAMILAPPVTPEVTKMLNNMYLLPSFMQNRINNVANELSKVGYRIIFNSVKGIFSNATAAVTEQPNLFKQTPSTSSPQGTNNPATPGATPSMIEESAKWLVSSSFKGCKLTYANFKHAPWDVVKGTARAVKDLLPPNVIKEVTQVTSKIKKLPLGQQLLGGTCVTLGTIGVYRYFRPASMTSPTTAQPTKQMSKQEDPEVDRLKSENKQLRLGLMRIQQELAQQPPPSQTPPTQPIVFKQYFTGAQPQAPAIEPVANAQSNKETPASFDEESYIDEESDIIDSEPQDSTSMSYEISHGSDSESSENPPSSSQFN